MDKKDLNELIQGVTLMRTNFTDNKKKGAYKHVWKCFLTHIQRLKEGEIKLLLTTHDN